MLRRANNKFFAAVGDNSLTSAVPAAGTVITAANLPSGAIVLTDLGLRRVDNSTSGADLTAMGTTEQFLVVQGLGSSKPLLKSEPMTIGNTKITVAKHVISRQQVTIVGYNRASTAGSLPAANDTDYWLKIRKNDNDAANRSQPSSKFGQFKSDASGTQEELAFGMVTNLIKNFALEPANNYLNVEATGDGTVVDFTGTATAMYFTKGSKTVTFVDLERAASTGTIADNDIINVPSSGGTSFSFSAHATGPHDVVIGDTVYTTADAGTAAQNATAIAVTINAGTLATAVVATALVTITLKPCAIALPPFVTNDTGGTDAIVAITILTGDANEVKYRADGAVSGAASFTLDAAYQGETGYVLGGTTVATMCGVASVTNYGIKLTGVQADFDVNAFRDYYVNRFTVSFADGDTLVTSLQGAMNGTGMGYQVLMDEYETWGTEGQNEMLSVPPKNRETVATKCAEYSSISIEWTESITGLVGQSGAKGMVLIYCELDGDSTLPVTNASGEVADVLGDIASPTFAVTALDK